MRIGERLGAARSVAEIDVVRNFGFADMRSVRTSLMHVSPANERIRAALPFIADNPFLSFEASPNLINTSPLTVGAFFSGGNAAGGHNILAGIYDAITSINPESRLIGFFGGPDGLLNGEGRPLSKGDIDRVRNQGGFDLLQTSRTKIETQEQLQKCAAVVMGMRLNGLIVGGGDDSNTNAGFLANYFLRNHINTSVIGMPKTIDGDMAFPPYLQTSFGFHTATRIYAETVGNICRDAASINKYWHFIRLMGRSASHIALEVALQTQPNMALIGEEIKSKGLTLSDIVDQMTGMIAARHSNKLKHGVVLIPEGIVEFIPEVKKLISAINEAIGRIGHEKFMEMRLEERKDSLIIELDESMERFFVALPHEVQTGLLSGLDPHGNVQVAQISSDILLRDLCAEKLAGEGITLSSQAHYLGYEGRCAYPTWFDATYTYNLGRVGAALVANGLTGYLASIMNVDRGLENWEPVAIPLAAMMGVEQRKGHESTVISKYMVELDSPAFLAFAALREGWMLEDKYMFPGPIQFFGPDSLVKDTPLTVGLNSGSIEGL